MPRKITTPSYLSWKGMKQRCNDPNHMWFSVYGGKGIKVCKRWEKYENFLKDMGERPSGTTLDRIDNDKGYYKENCRWATIKEQNNNTNRNRYFVYKVMEKDLIR